MADKQNPLDDMTKFMGQFKLPGVDMAAIIEQHLDRVDALINLIEKHSIVIVSGLRRLDTLSRH